MTSGEGAPGPRGDPGAALPEQDEARPLIERLGLAAIAILVVALFSAIAYAALSSGEVFLGAMAAIGALMTTWAAGASLRRG